MALAAPSLEDIEVDSSLRIASCEYEGDAIGILRTECLLQIMELLRANNFHGVVCKRADQGDSDIQRLRRFASFVFSENTRMVNTGIHIDAIDRPESVDAVATALFSPRDSYSNIPTWTVDTLESDPGCRAFLESGEGKELVQHNPSLCESVRRQIFAVFSEVGALCSEDTLGFWSLFHNYFLKSLDRRDLRGESAWHILTNSSTAKSVCMTQGQESMLFIKNSLRHREVAHARCAVGPGLFSIGNMFNFTIEGDGSLRPNNPVMESLLLQGVSVNPGGITNIRRGSIVP